VLEVQGYAVLSDGESGGIEAGLPQYDLCKQGAVPAQETAEGEGGLTMRLIDADALVADIIEDRQHQSFVTYDGRDRYMAMSEYAHDWVADAPTIDAEPVRHGRWIRQDDTFTRYMCSECESKNHDGHEKYCPNCGAKMDAEVGKRGSDD
jgi:rRNA maturation endonuclease Nob1